MIKYRLELRFPTLTSTGLWEHCSNIFITYVHAGSLSVGASLGLIFDVLRDMGDGVADQVALLRELVAHAVSAYILLRYLCGP